MAELRIDNPANRLPGADEPNSPAISFGEGATTTMLDILRGMGGWNVQITDEHGTFEALVLDNPVETDDRGIYSVSVFRTTTDAGGTIHTIGEPELVPLDRLLRLHVW